MSGYEALPARERTARNNKRSRKIALTNVEEDGTSTGGSHPGATTTTTTTQHAHSYEVFTEAEVVGKEPAPIYDSALYSTATHVEDDLPGEVEGSGGMGKWEYLDHTADVQIHTWGTSLPEAFAQQALGMWGYMTDLRGLSVDPACTRVVEARGVDLISLLFAWLDGCLCCYGSDYFVGREVAVTGWEEGVGGCCIRAIVRGERFQFEKHSQGTEVKAITYSNMQIFTLDGKVITANDAQDVEQARGEGGAGGGVTAAALVAPAALPALRPAAGGGGSGEEDGGEAVRGLRRGPVDIYCIVDI